MTPISQTLKDGSHYTIAAVGTCVVLTLSHPDVAMTVLEIVRFREQLADVAAAVGR
jgi:hypothetical protein